MNLNPNDVGLVIVNLLGLIFLVYLINHHKHEDLFDGVDMTSYHRKLNDEFDATFNNINIHDETVED